MIAAVVNHEHTDEALKLGRAFSAHCATVLLDSGSTLNSEQRTEFTECLPNVYYSGLLNAAVRQADSRPDEEPMLFWCSDVGVKEHGKLVRLAEESFADPGVGVYAPSAWFSGHAQMWNKGTGTLRPVLFVEGFCFAARLGLLRKLCPVDTSVNCLGWGLDLQLGFIAHRSRYQVCVDDRIEVQHPRSTGYSTADARSQRSNWLAKLSPEAQRFHSIATLRIAKRRPVVTWLSSMAW